MLKPCPFCGSDNVITYAREMPGPPSPINFVTCKECGAVCSFRGNETSLKTRRLWNKRTKWW